MTQEYRKGHHTVTCVSVQIVWAIKYRYHVLQGDVNVRCRDLLTQICGVERIEILKGVVSKDHVHIEYLSTKSISDIVKRLKGRNSRLLQQEYFFFKKRYWGRHFWIGGYGAGNTENINR